MNESEDQAVVAPRPKRPRRDGIFRPLFAIAVAVFLLQAGFIGGLLVERELVQGGRWSNGDLSLASTVFRLVQEDYYTPPSSATPEAEFNASLDRGAAAGILQTLDDYSQFLPPREADQAAAELAGKYEGIGVYAEFRDGTLTVTAPMKGSPAEDAGIQGGDVILAVDGTSIGGLAEDDAFARLLGPAGTTVALTIERDGAPAPLHVVVARAAIEVPVVEYQLLPGTRVAHIVITIFGDTTTTQLDEALQRAAADEVEGIVLDLRGNGGGWVRSAQEAVGRFVPASRGPALYEDDVAGPGGENPLPILSGSVHSFEQPLTVVVDSGTASAAEIVVGAIQHYGRAQIVGQRTFGKGSVQRVYEFADGSAARITSAEWLTPARQRLEGQGIAPNVEVDTENLPADANDVALEAALAALSTGASSTPTASPSATPASA